MTDHGHGNRRSAPGRAVGAASTWSRRPLLIIGLILGAVFAGFPVLWMLSSSFKTNTEIFAAPAAADHRAASRSTPTRRSSPTRPSCGSSSTATSSPLSVTAPDAARRDPGRRTRSAASSSAARRIINVVIVSVQAVPPITLLIPYFGLMVALGLYNTYPGLILTYMVFTLPYAIIMMTGVLQHPAARSSTRPSRSTAPARWTALWRILVPISVPGIVSVGVYTFMIAWNEYLFALTLTRTDDMRTVPIGIQLLMGQHSYEWNQMMAMSILGSHPGAHSLPLLPALLHRRAHRRRREELTRTATSRTTHTRKENTPC